MAYIARRISGARMTTGQSRVGGLFQIKPKVKLHFFDRSIIRTRWRRFNRDPLMAAGALVMRIARNSIKRRKLGGKPSQPGMPPRSRQPGTLPPFKQIFFRPMYLGTSVVVGMVGYTRQNPPPGLHEHGGYANRKVFSRVGQRRHKRTGRMGKIQYQYKPTMVKYPQRAFMFPALLRGKARLPNLWRGSISR